METKPPKIYAGNFGVAVPIFDSAGEYLADAFWETSNDGKYKRFNFAVPIEEIGDFEQCLARRRKAVKAKTHPSVTFTFKDQAELGRFNASALNLVDTAQFAGIGYGLIEVSYFFPSQYEQLAISEQWRDNYEVKNQGQVAIFRKEHVRGAGSFSTCIPEAEFFRQSGLSRKSGPTNRSQHIGATQPLQSNVLLCQSGAQQTGQANPPTGNSTLSAEELHFQRAALDQLAREVEEGRNSRGRPSSPALQSETQQSQTGKRNYWDVFGKLRKVFKRSKPGANSENV